MRLKTKLKLEHIDETKALIKAALIEKGQIVEDSDTFRSYADKILAIRGGGGLSSDERVKYVTFMHGDTILETYPVIVGDAVRDRAIDNGWSESTEQEGWVENPVIDTTISTIYPVTGWSLSNDSTVDPDALENVTEDRTVYAVVVSKPRKYMVTFYDGNKVLQSKHVDYGTKATPPNTFKDGYVFSGWTSEDGTLVTDLLVTGDMNFYGTWKYDLGWLIAEEFPDTYSHSRFAHYSPDGKYLYFANGHTLYAYSATTQPYKLLESVNIDNGSSGSIRAITISPNGKWLVASFTKSAFSKALRIYDISAGFPVDVSYLISSITWAASGAAATIAAMEFSADSSKLIVNAGKYFGVIDCTSSYAWTAAWSSTGKSSGFLAISVDSSGTKLAAVSFDNNVPLQVYDMSNNFENVTRRFISYSYDRPGYPHTGEGTLLAYSSDGKYLVYVVPEPAVSNVTSCPLLIVYNTTTTPYTVARIVRAVNYEDEYTGISFNADNSLLAVSMTQSPYVHVYDTSTWTLKKGPLALPAGPGSCCALGTDALFVGLRATPGVALYKIKE